MNVLMKLTIVHLSLGPCFRQSQTIRVCFWDTRRDLDLGLGLRTLGLWLVPKCCSIKTNVLAFCVLYIEFERYELLGHVYAVSGTYAHMYITTYTQMLIY